MEDHPKKDYHNIEVPVDAQLFAALNLEGPKRAGQKGSKTVEKHAATNGAKINVMLRAALLMSSDHFPLMSLQAWLFAIAGKQRFGGEQQDTMLETILRRDLQDHMASRFFDGEHDAQNVVRIRERLAALNSAEVFCVRRVTDWFWAIPRNKPCDLREKLSDISGRPKECVLEGDPAVEDLWEVSEVTIVDGSAGHAAFTYVGVPMAVLKFDVNSDALEIWCAEFECDETRPLVLPGQDIQSVLLDLARSKILEAVCVAPA